MKAWICRRYVDPFEINLEDVQEREPKEGEVQVEVRAAGINFGETLILSGNYQVKPTLPYIFGVEGSGVVRKCGPGVTAYKPGDEVIILNSDMANNIVSGDGCCAEITTVSQKWVYPKPANISFEQAASFPANYFTVYNAFFRRDPLKKGEVLVVHGAAGGVGVAGIQFGKMLGATVIATAGSDDKLAVVKELGADHVINYNKESIRDRVLEITGGRGADVYLDPVGGDMFEVSMRAIAPGGRILIVGFTSGKHVKAATNIILVKMISVIGIEARAFTLKYPELYRQDMESVMKLVADGKLKPYYSKAFGISELPEAFKYMMDRKVISKCVLANS